MKRKILGGLFCFIMCAFALLAAGAYTVQATDLSGTGVATLSSLEISPGTLDPEFSSDVYEYSVQVDSDCDKLLVTASTTDSGAKFVVVGNSGLKEGSNTVYITVTAADGSTTAKYTITVTRGSSAEEETEEEESSLASISTASSVIYLAEPAEQALPDGVSEVTISTESGDITAWKLSSLSGSRYYLVYGYESSEDESGAAFYLYDTENDTVMQLSDELIETLTADVGSGGYSLADIVLTLAAAALVVLILLIIAGVVSESRKKKRMRQNALVRGRRGRTDAARPSDWDNETEDSDYTYKTVDIEDLDDEPEQAYEGDPLKEHASSADTVPQQLSDETDKAVWENNEFTEDLLRRSVGEIKDGAEKPSGGSAGEKTAEVFTYIFTDDRADGTGASLKDDQAEDISEDIVIEDTGVTPEDTDSTGPVPGIAADAGAYTEEPVSQPYEAAETAAIDDDDDFEFFEI